MRRGLPRDVGGLKLLVCLLVVTGGCNSPQPRESRFLEYEARTVVTKVYPHSPEAFTQGLLLKDGWLVESTGLFGSSRLQKIELATGRVGSTVSLPEDVFGEGVAAIDERLVQLSWRNGRAFIWSADTLELEGEFHYDGEGWGLCYDGRGFVMSDGSAELQLRDSHDFALVSRVSVRNQGVPLDGLNELECVEDDVFANILGRRHIARIHIASGEVVQWIDTGGILQHADPSEELGPGDVLNGIAAIPGSERLLLTGKRWPNVFEVEVVPFFD